MRLLSETVVDQSCVQSAQPRLQLVLGILSDEVMKVALIFNGYQMDFLCFISCNFQYIIQI